MDYYNLSYYDNVEFTVATATTDYDVKSSQGGSFGGATSKAGELVHYVTIRTDQTIVIKFNSTGDDGITLTSSDSPFVLDEILEVRNIYITNVCGVTANIKIFLSKAQL